MEPLSSKFNPKYFGSELKKKKGKIKAVLMDQKIVTGLGNIYADESLFEAHIRPNRRASSLSASEIDKLHKAIIQILRRAIKVGGSSVATYRLLDHTKSNSSQQTQLFLQKFCCKI